VAFYGGGSDLSSTNNTTPLTDELQNYIRQWGDPEVGFMSYLQGHGLFGNDPLSHYARSQYQDTYSRYKLANVANPNLGFYDYLNQQQPSFAQDFGQQSPEARGQFSNVNSPRVKWVL
jgi:hypothetical protein